MDAVGVPVEKAPVEVTLNLQQFQMELPSPFSINATVNDSDM